MFHGCIYNYADYATSPPLLRLPLLRQGHAIPRLPLRRGLRRLQPVTLPLQPVHLQQVPRLQEHPRRLQRLVNMAPPHVHPLPVRVFHPRRLLKVVPRLKVRMEGMSTTKRATAMEIVMVMMNVTVRGTEGQRLPESH